MDAATAQQLAAAIQALAAAAAALPPPPAPPAPAAPEADPLTSPTREVPLTLPLSTGQVNSQMELRLSHPSSPGRSMPFNSSWPTSRQEPRHAVGTIQHMVSLRWWGLVWSSTYSTITARSLMHKLKLLEWPATPRMQAPEPNKTPK